jgi:hypothetical protein
VITMNAASPELAVHAAPHEMAALAAAVRPDWDPDIIAGVLQRARDDRMPWKQVLLRLPHLMANPDASPRDLLKPSGPVLTRKEGAEPGEEWRRARQELEQRRAAQ